MQRDFHLSPRDFARENHNFTDLIAIIFNIKHSKIAGYQSSLILLKNSKHSRRRLGAGIFPLNSVHNKAETRTKFAS